MQMLFIRRALSDLTGVLIQFFNQTLVLLGPGAVIYSRDNDVSVLSRITFKVFLSLNLDNSILCRFIILEFNQNKRSCTFSYRFIDKLNSAFTCLLFPVTGVVIKS